MTPVMSSRQRVSTSIEHNEPDRVPTALGGGPYSIVDSLYFRLLPLLQLDRSVLPFRKGHNVSYMDDRLFERLGTDTRYVWPGASPSDPIRISPGGESFWDSYGQEWKRALPYYYAGRGLLANATHQDEIDTIVKWPDLTSPTWGAGVALRAKTLQENTSYYVIARSVASYGPFQTACNLRGTEAFLMDMATDPSFAVHLLERITQTLVGLLVNYLEAGGRYFNMIELPGDDYASRSGLLISPGMFRQFIKPALKRLVSTVKEYRPELVVMFHSDGRVESLLPDLIELGIDVVHPLEPLPGVDYRKVKSIYGQKLAFLGAIDISHAMPGSVQDVEREVRQRITKLAAGGGYILAPSNHLQEDVPPENVVELYKAARKYGEYQ